ncbi:glycine receptor subunit alpha-3-like isoform X2 [Liolophura sinensis]|uniref:glycine receptor subunit alpha-3-like isoform X2 n=1 Tax=Liolophura sinensis TaxID=3198878 RepID=UPI003159046E
MSVSVFHKAALSTLLPMHRLPVQLLCLVTMLSLSEELSTTEASPKRASTRRTILDDLLIDYDPKISPHYDEDIPTNVSVQIYIYSVDTFNEAAMVRTVKTWPREYSLTIFVRQKWHDARLSYSAYPIITEPLELDTKIMARVWVPDLYFTNEKRAAFHVVTVPNKLMHLYRNGTIFYSVRLSMTLSCMMNLHKYPFDTQICGITAESYSYTTDYLVFSWFDHRPIEYSDSLLIPQFKKQDTTALDCTKTYGEVGNFTCIRASIVLERDIWYYVIQVYIPSTLIVILSWVSFWLDVDAIPARITLGVLTVLTLTTQSSSLRNTLPKVSYIKAIDVWMALCLGFVFSALLEFAFVNVLSRRKKNDPNVESKTGSEVDDIKQEDETCESKTSLTLVGRKRALCLDRVSRVLFPAVFSFLNIFYWLFYTVWL